MEDELKQLEDALHIVDKYGWSVSTMYCHEGWSGVLRPMRMSVMADMGMLTLPL